MRFLSCVIASFNGHPPLGVNATHKEKLSKMQMHKFQWAPTLGGECYFSYLPPARRSRRSFQWAPTLGGECYMYGSDDTAPNAATFQWAPTLGGECYPLFQRVRTRVRHRFNGHPPLGVNATEGGLFSCAHKSSSFNGHPPLGVNATV